jgi:hypothetical protein
MKNDEEIIKTPEPENLAEYLEYLARVIPTTMPEWMD